MTKNRFISACIIFLAIILGYFQNASAESLSGAYNSGSATSTNPPPGAFENVISVIVNPTSATDVLVVATFSVENVASPATTRNATFQLTDGTTPSGAIIRSIDNDDAGIGSLVYIATGVSGSTTYTLQHRSDILNVVTSANLAAIPLLTNLTAQTLANATARVNGPVTIPGATFSEVTGTAVTVLTNGLGVGSIGSFYVAASVQTYKTSGGGSTDTGEWQLQYSDDGGTNWYALGYPIHRSVTGNADNGIVNLVGDLQNKDASATNYRFRVAHRHASGSGTLNSANVNIVAVFTGFNDGTNDHIFDTESTLISSASTTSATLVRAGGFNFQPTVNTDLFLHVPYFISAKGQTHAIYDLFISGKLDSLDQKRALATANDRGSGASVGLATGLIAGTGYDVQLRHAQDTSGQTINTNNANIIAWDLNSRILDASTCPHIPPQTPTRTPGPDNALFYDGTDNYVAVPHDARLDLTDTFSIECWVKPDSIGGIQTLIGKDDGTPLPVSLQLNGAYLEVTYDHSTGTRTLTDGTNAPDFPFTTCKWYHAAATLDAGTLTLYVNGVAAESIAGAETPSTNSQPMAIGQSGNSSNYFNGVIDEVRIWQDYAFGTTGLRDWMCKKVTSDHPAWANLSAYYRFDENGLDTVYDYSENGIDGTAKNFTFEEERICSSAPIGDESAHDYTGNSATPGDFSATLTYAPEGDFMTATGDGGTWANAGIQLYLVDEPPNSNVPPVEWGPDYVLDPKRYWGVFVANGTSPTYQIEYDWGLHQGLTFESWTSLKLAYRDGNCDIPWQDLGASLPTPPLTPATPRTLTKTGLTGTEFILGGKVNSGDPLAIVLAEFSATVKDGCVDILWETATEINTAGFHVWRSDNPFTGFVRITGSMVASTSEMETMGAAYSFRDCGVDFANGEKYYYMLEEIEIDTTGSGNMHGPIGPVSEAIAAAQGGSDSSNKACFIDSVMWE